MYRSRRRVLRRLVIPGALAAIIVGAAVGATTSYLTSQSPTGAQHRSHAHAAPKRHARPATQPGSTAAAPTAPASTSSSGGDRTASGPVPASGAADGRLLNDEGYARIQLGEYAGAIPLLRQAVEELRGVGPGDPYEAYANYNLGYALLQVGDCTGAVPPLDVANRLESSPLVDIALRRASACAHQGS
jgi:TolA-binding protein